MTPERWQQIDTLLGQARELPGGERAGFLDTACGGDGELRREVETLLALDQEDAFLDHAVFSLHGTDRELGRCIGSWELVRLLGRGGMGAVYLAARRDDYHQQVALKLIKRGMDSDEILRRFHNERQILADLDHPNIARLLDGGTTTDGRPYFVMEYIEGQAIDRYCAEHRLSIRRRLELFRQVCSAVRLSHQKLVVHRDLKPGNILVSENDGVPKLLDFGIAKMLAPSLVEQSLATLPGSQPRTSGYASPEQLRGEVVTTASDIYSLGVLLYLLLAGRHPHRLDKDDPPSEHELRHRVLEDDAPKPSGVAEGRRGRLSGDLDAIVLEALAKEPERRYGSVEQLSEDIRRYLVGLPVAARRGDFGYRAAKFLRRNRWPVAVFVLLVALGLTTSGLWRQAVEERELAVQQQRRADLTVLLLEHVIRVSDPERPGLPPQQVILERGRSWLEEEEQDDPRHWADLIVDLASAYHDRGLYREALALMEETLGELRKLYPEDHPELAEGINNLAVFCFNLGELERAEDYSREALAIKRRLGQDDTIESVRTLNNLASILLERGSYAEAEALYRQGLAIRERHHGPSNPNVATSLRSLANTLYQAGDPAAAEPLLRRALAIRIEHYDPEHPRVASVLDKLASVRLALGDVDDAEALFHEALRIERRAYGDDHDVVAHTQTNLAELLLADPEPTPEGLDTAALLLRQALATLLTQKGPEVWEVARVESLLGAHHLALGHPEEAEPCLRQGHRMLVETLGPQSPHTRAARQRLERLPPARRHAVPERTTH